MSAELKTPEAWCAELGARILDHDGWRDGTRSWDEPIDRAEFDRRLIRCTIDSRAYPSFYRVPTDHCAAQEPHNRDLTASEVGPAHGDGSDDERAGE